MKRFRKLPRWAKLLAIVALLLLIAAGGYIALRLYSRTASDSNSYVYTWLTSPESRADMNTERQRCGNAPFILPSAGFVGLLWSDPAAPYTLFNPHTGIDIFGDGGEGEVPVYAVADGYLSRLDNWFGSVIIAHDDPLKPGETLWSYYTHLASENGVTSYIVDAFPAGTSGVRVEQGTLLGYQGKYNGNRFPVAVHVHISLVKSGADGSFTNETALENTVDPSPYFGLTLHQGQVSARPIRCH